MSIFIHNTSVIDSNPIGARYKNLALYSILSETIIGERCSFGQNCVVGPRVKLGNF